MAFRNKVNHCEMFRVVYHIYTIRDFYLICADAFETHLRPRTYKTSLTAWKTLEISKTTLEVQYKTTSERLTMFQQLRCLRER